MAAVDLLLLLAFASFLAGLAGSYLGIGGGIFLIPFMTLALGIDIKVAIATSLIGARPSSAVFAHQRAEAVRWKRAHHHPVAEIDDHDVIGLPAGAGFGGDRDLPVRRHLHDIAVRHRPFPTV